MPRKPDFSPMPPHPSIISEPYLGRYQDKSRVVVQIKCPRCEEVRVRTATETRKEATRPNYKGLCRPCALLSVGEGTHRWRIADSRENPNKRNNNGYVYVLAREVEDHLLPMYRSMQRSRQPVLEHRWVMAKHLGRALRSDEMVDHMNGVKTDNRIENLRIYVKGKQQPGSCPGHGTYYDEWQRALARISELEKKIA
jgi:hypothetical protein